LIQQASEQGGETRTMYQCATCTHIFKSHEALGGHRASHKKVKRCVAGTNINDEDRFER
jgi:DNA-directed RNA polymerase subunit RPC12/RpoP